MAGISAVAITLYTEDDDKDMEEHVTTFIKYGDETLAQNVRGAMELWPNNSQQSFGLKLSREIPVSDTGNMKIVVSKSCEGSDTGCGWNMSLAVTGTLSTGGAKVLLARTSPVRMGDDNPVSREWAFA